MPNPFNPVYPAKSSKDFQEAANYHWYEKMGFVDKLHEYSDINDVPYCIYNGIYVHNYLYKEMNRQAIKLRKLEKPC